ncbi:Slc34a2, partial [Symbiodinium pilosum]
VLAALYFFLFGLDLMGGSFAALGGKGAAQLFTFTDNPISGLMVGVLATVLVQSSSTSTSIVVGLVGAEVVSVKQAIPIVMGANIGTSVTNTIVSMGHVGDRSELERAFSGATVHDMFNMFSVLVLLPLEVAIGAVTGGGLLFWISKSLTEAISGSANSQLTFKSPIKIVVSDLTKIFLKKDKDVIKALSFGAPAADVTSNGTYYCVSEKVCKVWRKVAKRSCEALTPCAFASTCPSRCYTDAGSFYAEEIERARTIKGGFLKGAGDVAGGMIGLALSLVILCIALGAMVRLLHSLVMGQAKRATVKGASMNNYVAMLIGVGLTIIVPYRLGEPGGRQCSGQGRQPTDYIYTIHKLMHLEREWRLGLRWLKLDISKAFDRVSRGRLMRMLEEKIGHNRLSKAWYEMLKPTRSHLQTCWGATTFEMRTGIRQGAVESPMFFGMLAELCVQTASEKYGWAPECPGAGNLPLRDILYMDDAVMWDVQAEELATRVEQLARELKEWGLEINLAKCQYYSSPYATGNKELMVMGQTMHSDKHLDVMGTEVEHKMATKSMALFRLLCLAEIVQCGTVAVPISTFRVMMLAAWHVLCSLYVWREILVPAPLASAGLEAPCTAEVNTAKSASGKTWQDFLGGYGVSNLRPGCGDPLYQSLEGRERQAMAEDRPSSVGSCDGYPEQKEGDASVFMEEARQPGFLEDDRLDTFINELVDRVRQLRATDVRVARDLAVVVGTHIRMLPIQEAWFAAMRHLVNVHTNENGMEDPGGNGGVGQNALPLQDDEVEDHGGRGLTYVEEQFAQRKTAIRDYKRYLNPFEGKMELMARDYLKASRNVDEQFAQRKAVMLDYMMYLLYGEHVLEAFWANALVMDTGHLFFNILGILIWYPFPPMRRPIIAAACTLGFYASYWRLLPLLYILVMFLAVPGLALVISLLYTVSVAGGVAATMFVLAALASFEYWWFKKGCYKVVSKEQRQARLAEIQEDEEKSSGESAPVDHMQGGTPAAV